MKIPFLEESLTNETIISLRKNVKKKCIYTLTLHSQPEIPGVKEQERCRVVSSNTKNPAHPSSVTVVIFQSCCAFEIVKNNFLHC